MRSVLPLLVLLVGSALAAEPVTAEPVTAEPVTAEPATAEPTTAEPDRSALDSDPASRLWLYFGADGGYTGVRPTSGSRESDRDGYAIHVKALFSKYFRDWVGDLGIGYAHHFASGADQFSPLSDANVGVKTRAGFVEFSPRYRLDPHDQLGLVVNGFFGTDVAFDESTTDPDQGFALAAGVRYDWETSPDEDRRWRFGVQAMHDLTVSDRGIWWIMADVQFGIPFLSGGGSTPEPVSSPSPVPSPAPAAETPVRPSEPKFAEVTPERSVKVYLGEAVLRFRTASAELRPSSIGILEKVAKYLDRSPDAWTRIRVEGHADKRGRLDYNRRLSKRRADRVKQELVRLGVPAEKMTTEGFGPTRPIDPADDLEAYALNRRVELWIDGLKDPESVVRDLNELK